ncbi:MAG: class I SAM-dependent RNA methyltransferase, partial [Eubacterium sp.]|nr:class I SAM-dependent RNA methyltransferase [Eubacterium sp.]
MNCPVMKKCGGCQLLNLSYEEQLSFKQATVIKLLGRFHHIDEIIGMDNPYHYRNKVQAAFSTDRNKNIISGVYQSSTHRVVNVDSCLLEDETADRINVTVRKLLKSFKLTPFNEDTGKGFLRHTLIKRGFKSGQVMVVLVSGTNIFPKKRQFVNALVERHPEITTVIWNINDKRTSLVLGNRNEVLYGDGKIEEELCKKKFRISPSAFYQISPVQTEVLYNKALEFAQ